MRSRLTTVLLVAALAAFGTGAAFATSAHLGHGKKHHHAKKHKHAKKHQRHSRTQAPVTQTQPSTGQSSAQSQYGTRPGKGCGDTNHVHTGPPGNPSNTACPPQSKHGTTGPTSPTGVAKSKAKRHHGRHHTRKSKRHHRHSS